MIAYEIRFINYDENNVPYKIGTRICLCEETPTLKRVKDFFDEKLPFPFESIEVEKADPDDVNEILEYGDIIPEI